MQAQRNSLLLDRVMGAAAFQAIAPRCVVTIEYDDRSFALGGERLEGQTPAAGAQPRAARSPTALRARLVSSRARGAGGSPGEAAEPARPSPQVELDWDPNDPETEIDLDEVIRTLRVPRDRLAVDSPAHLQARAAADAAREAPLELADTAATEAAKASPPAEPPAPLDPDGIEEIQLEADALPFALPESLGLTPLDGEDSDGEDVPNALSAFEGGWDDAPSTPPPTPWSARPAAPAILQAGSTLHGEAAQLAAARDSHPVPAAPQVHAAPEGGHEPTRRTLHQARPRTRTPELQRPLASELPHPVARDAAGAPRDPLPPAAATPSAKPRERRASLPPLPAVARSLYGTETQLGMGQQLSAAAPSVDLLRENSRDPTVRTVHRARPRTRTPAPPLGSQAADSGRASELGGRTTHGQPPPRSEGAPPPAHTPEGLRSFAASHSEYLERLRGHSRERESTERTSHLDRLLSRAPAAAPAAAPTQGLSDSWQEPTARTLTQTRVKSELSGAPSATAPSSAAAAAFGRETLYGNPLAFDPGAAGDGKVLDPRRGLGREPSTRTRLPTPATPLRAAAAAPSPTSDTQMATRPSDESQSLPRSRAFTPLREERDEWPAPDDADLMFRADELQGRRHAAPDALRSLPPLPAAAWLAKLKARATLAAPDLGRKRWMVPAAAGAVFALVGGATYVVIRNPPGVELTVAVTPGDAQVTLDGHALTGAGAQRRERVARGRHELVAHKPGFISEHRAVTVGERATSYSAVVTLAAEQRSASLSVSSIPSGARIQFDGKDTGKTTPAALSDIAVGPHSVALQLDGYTPAEQAVRVPEDALVTVSLVAAPSEPPAAAKPVRAQREAVVRAPSATPTQLTEALLQRRARVNAARAVCRQNGRDGAPLDPDADATLRAIGQSCREAADAAASR